jgi:nucleotide-binding universal stress UspA family protein
MIAIRTVVCPVDFSAASARQLELACNVCQAWDARLVVHHNITDVSPGAAVGWMWHADHVPAPSFSPDDALRAWLRRLPEGIVTEGCLTRGAATEAVLSVSDAADADLIVLSAHAGKTDDHTSVIEFLLDHSRRPVLALHDPGDDLRVPRFGGRRRIDQPVLVPVNLAHDAHAQVGVACDLARTCSMHVHLLHVEPWRTGVEAAIRTSLLRLLPEDFGGRASAHVEAGDPAPTIARVAERIGASLIIMGEHTRVPVKRWLKRNTSRDVLHDARCPVWYVPSAGFAPLSLSRFALSAERSPFWGNV